MKYSTLFCICAFLQWLCRFCWSFSNFCFNSSLRVFICTMSGINRKTFYAKKDDYSDSDSSDLRWGPTNILKDDTVVPPTEPSEAASASTCLSPPSKFSSAKGSVTTSPEDHANVSLVSSFAKPVISTRFTKALMRSKILSQYYTAPAEPGQLTPSKKCSTWVEQAQLGKKSNIWITLFLLF